MKQGIIFDMDGTLWDSADGVAKSWTQVIQNEYKKDMAVTEQDIKRVMGKTMDVIGDIFFPAPPSPYRHYRSVSRPQCLRSHAEALMYSIYATAPFRHDDRRLFPNLFRVPTAPHGCGSKNFGSL